MLIKSIIKKIAYYGFKLFPKTFLKLTYLVQMKSWLNLQNPTKLSEKINYLNIYNKNELSSKCADKYKMREYVSEKGYSEYLVELLGVYEQAEEIDFKSLPEKFVLKCNHGCGYNIICQDKATLNISKTINSLKKWSHEQYGYRGGEFHYNEIDPKIICEKYIDGLADNHYPIDYKMHCFNGKVIFTLCCSNREEKVKFSVYDREWNKVDGITDAYKTDKVIEKPKDYQKMIEIAESLSQPFKIVRIDFYELNGKAILGEITVTPAAGRPKYFTREFDRIMGQCVEIQQAI